MEHDEAHNNNTMEDAVGELKKNHKFLADTPKTKTSLAL